MKDQRIRLLPEQTINQIAAGEVIENAASVIKELIDNALDAGAQRIVIETSSRLLRISDDGCGMHPDDLLLAIERHATSKILAVEDLNSLNSLGFRGEALPSIASISKLSIHSATEAGEGMLLQVQGGRVEKIVPAPRKKGTTIEVGSLFFNVPVRKKFQKSASATTAEIYKLLTKISLCYPHVAISWKNEEKNIFTFLEDTSLKERIRLLLGEEFLSSLFAIETAKSSLSLTGFLGNAQSHRPNRAGQYLFVNFRPINSPWISEKILEGYGTRLPLNRYPIFVLHLSMPPEWIDVNVHPQKKEVRLRHEETLQSFLHEALEKSLHSQQRPPSPLTAVSVPLQKVSPSLFSLTTPPIKEPSQEEPLPLTFSFHLIGIVGTYLLIEDQEGIRMIDALRARLRIAYEDLFEKNKKNSIQTLLIPLQLEFSGAESMRLVESLELLETLGISIRSFGRTTFLIDALPSCLKQEEVKPFLHLFLEEGEKAYEKRVYKSLLKTLKKTTVSLEEGKILLKRLFQCKNFEKTPDGKPIHSVLTEEEIARRFS